MLSLEDVSKKSGAIQSLSGIDLDIERGDAVGLMGDNRAGISTLVKIIAGNSHRAAAASESKTTRFNSRNRSMPVMTG